MKDKWGGELKSKLAVCFCCSATKAMDILISTTYLSPVCSFLSAVQPAWSVHLEFLHVNAYLQWPKRWLYNFSSLSSGQRHFWRPYFKTIDLNEDVLLAVFLWKFYFEASMSETFGSGSVLLKPLIVYLCSLKYDFQLHIATGHLNSKDCMCVCVMSPVTFYVDL